MKPVISSLGENRKQNTDSMGRGREKRREEGKRENGETREEGREGKGMREGKREREGKKRVCVKFLRLRRKDVRLPT